MDLQTPWQRLKEGLEADNKVGLGLCLRRWARGVFSPPSIRTWLCPCPRVCLQIANSQGRDHILFFADETSRQLVVLDVEMVTSQSKSGRVSA